MTRSEVQNMRTEIETVLDKLGEKHGITLKMGNISFHNAGFNTKLTCVAGTGAEAEQAEFDRNASFSDAKGCYGQRFLSRGDVYKITGYKPRSRKFPIVAVSPAGTSYKFTASVLKTLIPMTKT